MLDVASWGGVEGRSGDGSRRAWSGQGDGKRFGVPGDG